MKPSDFDNLLESSSSLPIAGDFLRNWVSDPTKPNWTAEELAADPQINGTVKNSDDGEWVDVPGEAFIMQSRGRWEGYQYDAGYKPPGFSGFTSLT